MTISLVETQQINNVRPTPSFVSPTHVYCHTFLRQHSVNTRAECDHLNSIIEHKTLVSEALSNKLKRYRGKNVELRVEVHNEFICYVWILSKLSTDSDVLSYIQDVPVHWLTHFPGRILTQSLLSFEKGNIEKIPFITLERLFGKNQLIGNFVENESARVWSDFHADPKNPIFRVQIDDFSLGPKRSGRLAQCLLELENYRSLSEIAFPIAEDIVFELEKKEQYLTEIIQEIPLAIDEMQQQNLLYKLLDLSSSSEQWRSKTGHRFSATSAYKNIFLDRLNTLDESTVLGYQSFSKFLSRAIMPTFRTCDAANDRLNVFITRIDRAISLLSTRIRSKVEQQNNTLLNSVDKQNKQQIILQETLEAFAIIAISYNSCALIKLFLDSLKLQGLDIDTPLWISISIPTTLLGSFLLMRFLRKRKQGKFR